MKKKLETQVLVVGAGATGTTIARELSKYKVDAMVVEKGLDVAGGLIRNEVQCLYDFDIPLLLEHTVAEIHGRERVEAVTIARVDKKWDPMRESRG